MIYFYSHLFGNTITDVLLDIQPGAPNIIRSNFKETTLYLLFCLVFLMIVPLLLGFVANSRFSKLQNINLCIIPAIVVFLMQKSFTAPLHDYPILLSFLCAYLPVSITIFYKAYRDQQLILVNLTILFMRTFLLILLILLIKTIIINFTSDIFTIMVTIWEIFRPVLFISDDAAMINLQTWGERKDRFGQTKDSILDTNSIGVDPTLWSSFVPRFKTGAINLVNRVMEQSEVKTAVRIPASHVLQEIGLSPKGVEGQAMKKYLIDKEGVNPKF